MSALLDYARGLLVDELHGRGVNLAVAGVALDVAVPALLERPRASWPPAADPWEELVIGLAVVVRRLQGRGFQLEAAVNAVRAAAVNAGPRGPAAPGGSFSRAMHPSPLEPQGQETHDPLVSALERD